MQVVVEFDNNVKVTARVATLDTQVDVNKDVVVCNPSELDLDTITLLTEAGLVVPKGYKVVLDYRVQEKQEGFTEAMALELYNSEEQFPVDLNDAWAWLGYAKKQNAKDTLLEYFKVEDDFIRCGVKSSTGGRPSELIKLSVDCFKELGMLAKTDKGKQIRKYFLECERIAKSYNYKPKPLIKTPEAKVQLWLQEILSYTNLKLVIEVPMMKDDTFIRVDFINLSSPSRIKVYELKAHIITPEDIIQKISGGYIDAIDRKYGASPKRPLTLTFLSPHNFTMDAMTWLEQNTDDGYLHAPYLGTNHSGRSVRIQLITFKGFLQPIIDKLFTEHMQVSPIQAKNLEKLIYTDNRAEFIPLPTLAPPC